MGRFYRAVAVLLLLSTTLRCTCQRQDFSDRPVVEVNGAALSAKQFSDLLAIRLKPFDAVAAKDSAIVKKAKEDVLRDFILDVLIENWASQNGVFVRAEDLDHAVGEIRKGYPDDLSFKQALVEEGISFKEWREKLSSSLLQRLVAEKIKSSAKEPSDDELQAHYNSNKTDFQVPEQISLSQIVLNSEEDAQLVLSELKKGKEFASMAKKFSVTPEAEKGGDLGWISKGTLEVFDEGFRVGVNQRSGVIKSAYGFHILLNRGKKASQTLPFSEVRDKIRQKLLSNREQAVYSAWLEERIRAAQVKRDNGLIDNIRVETRGR